MCGAGHGGTGGGDWCGGGDGYVLSFFIYVLGGTNSAGKKGIMARL